MVKFVNRYMRIIVMYDIQMETNIGNKEYLLWRKKLINLGYIMMQYSIYSKCISAHTQYEYERQKLLNVMPKKSNIRIMLITENQYQKIEILNGEKSLNEFYNDNIRYVSL
ncbi:CRISPR-associated endonuclease Cas2 [Mycoplasma phocoenae]|uniref:CRISPR-associated endoribonuclease Cas2 n=2 Tax=Mycoplasma phocoenae TaxID=754517 RepID=A0A858U7P1_9MOLU|nr:CRISPR-associated endonuclease Cas2 [Mycoplasma phocoenae]